MNATLPRLPAFLYLILVFFGFFLNYPGRANSDSLVMFDNARNPDWLIDWHSPFVTFAWSIFDPWLGQPASGLLVQCLALFPLPAYFLSNALAEAKKAESRPLQFIRIVTAALLTLFCVYLVGYVFKDVSLVAITFLAAWAALKLSSSRESPGLGGGRGWVFLTLLGIYLVRPTNIVILAFVMLAILLRNRNSNYKKALLNTGKAILILATLLPLGSFINKRVLNAQPSAVESSLIIFDVAGISIHKKKNEFTSLPGWPKNLGHEIGECYSPKWWDEFSSWGRCPEYFLAMKSLALSENEKPDLVSWWLTKIVENPLAYLAHRMAFTKKFLYYTESRDSYLPIDNTRSALEFLQPDRLETYAEWKPNLRFTALHRGWVFFTQGVFGQPFFWLGLSVVGMVVSYRRLPNENHLRPLAFLVFAFGTGNMLMLAFFGVADLPRYALPTLLCSLAGYIFMVSSRILYVQRHS